MKNNKMEDKHLNYVDILRIMACFFVIVNHTINLVYINRELDWIWIFSMIYFFICKIAVPIFVMITGALLLKKEDTYKKTFIRVFRIVIVLILFAIPYYFAYSDKSGGHVTKSIVLNIIQDGVTNAFWYLYPYIGILIMMPLLQKLRSAMEDKDYIYMITISLFIGGCFPILAHYVPALNTIASIDLAIFDEYIGLLFVGDFISNKSYFEGRKNTVNAILLFNSLCYFKLKSKETHKSAKNPCMKKYNFFIIQKISCLIFANSQVS